MIKNNELFMRRCIQLARNGKIYAAPNPLVGAVIVHNNIIIGEGYHIKSGTAHAEVNAINSVKNKSLLKDSTIYVSLEPCSHTGKTPPCADLIIKCQIPRVVIGCLDSFAKVNGQGVQKLKDAGIEVTVGVLENECKALIKRFRLFHSLKRPYIILKWAQTPNGYIDRVRETGCPEKISSSLSQLSTQMLRSETSSILVGTNTARLDNPKLTVRYWYPKDPIRLVVDNKLSLNSNLNLFDRSTPTLVFNHLKEDLSDNNLLYIKFLESRNLIKEICSYLYSNNIQSILVEGGAKLHQSFIDQGLWDEIHIEIGDQPLDSGVSAANIPKNTFIECSKIWGRTFIRAFRNNN